jgi:hypothetical protein
VKAAVRSFAKQSCWREIGLKIFETSGTAAGQQTAFSLLDPGTLLAIRRVYRTESRSAPVQFDGLRCHRSRELGMPPRSVPEGAGHGA